MLLIIGSISAQSITYTDDKNDVSKDTITSNNIHTTYNNIDIDDITILKDDKTITLTLKVHGKIEDKGIDEENIESISDFKDITMYLIKMTTNKQEYIITYMNKDCTLMTGSSYDENDMSFNKNNNALTVTFDLLNKSEQITKIHIDTNFISMLTFKYDTFETDINPNDIIDENNEPEEPETPSEVKENTKKDDNDKLAIFLSSVFMIFLVGISIIIYIIKH